MTDQDPFWSLTDDLFSMHGPDGRFVDVNPAWERLLGFDGTYLLGRRPTDLVHPDDLDRATAVAEAAAGAAGPPREEEIRFLSSDGSYRWVMWSARSTADGWCGVGRDTTERRRAKAARELAQQRAAEVAQMTGLSTWWWAPAADQLVLLGELEAAREARHLPPTLDGTLELVDPSHRERVRDAMTRVAEGLDETRTVRFPLAGDERWFESRAVAIHGDGGRVEAVRGVNRDVTEVELARLELVHSRDFIQTTLDSLDAHVAVLDESGTIVFVNGAWTRFRSSDGAPGVGVGQNYLEVCDAAGAKTPEVAAAAPALRRMLEGSLSRYDLEYPAQPPCEGRWFHMTAVLHRADGPPRVVVQHRDITQRVEAESGQRLRSRLLDEVDAAVIATDLEGTITLWSRGAEHLYGWTEDEAMGEKLVDIALPTSFQHREDGFIRHLREHTRWEGDLELRRKDGTQFIGFARSSVVCDEEGTPVGLIGISVDATDRAETEHDLRRARNYLTAVIDSMGEGLIAVDGCGAILYMNATAEERLGWTSEQLVGRTLHETARPSRPGDWLEPSQENPLMAARPGGGTVRVDEDVFYRSDGTPLPISYTAAPFDLPEGETGAVILFSDITDRKRAESELRASAAQLKAIVENTSASIYVKRKGDFRYLMANPEFESTLDLEPGTAVGLRDEDLFSPRRVESLRQADRRVIDEGAELSMEEEIPGSRGLRTYLSLKFPLPDDQGRPYAVCGISTDITERKQREAELTERAECEERIRTAVDEDRLLVYTQPIIGVDSREVAQEELLVRIQSAHDPALVLQPGEFLPQAERFGMVGQIDRFMVHRGIELAAQGRSVAINLSGRSIGDRALIRQIEQELRTTGADPSKIVFEITETAAVEDIQAAREFSERIARMECKCALDDFGTGFGSLTYQRQLAVQYLKIDTSFVRGLAHSAADQQVVKNIVHLAQDYGQQTIAEGVEDAETLDRLADYGVDYAQGHHIGRPQPLGLTPVAPCGRFSGRGWLSQTS